MKKYFKRTLLQRTIFLLLPSSNARVKYLKKHNVFAEMGENCFYQCRKIPVEPQLVKIHNNVAIAADVHIIPHDVIHIMVNRRGGGAKYPIHLGCVEIKDNCFIGSQSIILPNVRIGPNAIVAAGAVVTKDVPENCIVAGNPAKVIGNLDSLLEKRAQEIGNSPNKYERTEELWAAFEKEREGST